MTAPELRAWIDSLTQDIDFAYHGKFGSICPFHREDIALCYDGYAVDAHSVDEAMALPFICGHSLAELCEELDISPPCCAAEKGAEEWNWNARGRC